jgi:hypothetical protein
VEGDLAALRREVGELRAALASEKERREALPAIRSEIDALRADLQLRTKTIGDVFEAFHAKLSEELAASREAARVELARIAERQEALFTRVGELEAALASSRDGATEALRRSEERAGATEERTRRLVDSLKKALEDLSS